MAHHVVRVSRGNADVAPKGLTCSVQPLHYACSCATPEGTRIAVQERLWPVVRYCITMPIARSLFAFVSSTRVANSALHSLLGTGLAELGKAHQAPLRALVRGGRGDFECNSQPPTVTVACSAHLMSAGLTTAP